MSNERETLLTIEHVRKQFEGKMVLSDVNFDIKKGEILCLIGQSGHGKSVLLKIIMGLLSPDGGKITYKGETILSPTTPKKVFEEQRHRFGLLFQGAALFDSLSVGENIGFCLREHTKMSELEIREAVSAKLAMVGLHDVEEVMPAKLSGGMRSRVGLARSVALEPEIMLYDEPTSALDPIMSDRISTLIEELRDRLEMTSVVITHDVALAYKVADRIAMLYNGKIIFLGTPAEIRSSHNPYIRQFLLGQRKKFYALENEDGTTRVGDFEHLKSSAPQKFSNVSELTVLPKTRKRGEKL